MPFRSGNDVIQRLTQNPAQLTETEIIDLYPWMQQLTTGAAHRLNAELALQTIQSIGRFDKNSTRVARLEHVVATSTEQQKLLQQSVEVANQQLLLIRRQPSRKK